MTNSKIADRRLPWLRYISHLADKWLLWGKFSGKISAHLIEQYLSMRSGKKNLTILSEAERAALYESPDFDHEQRLEYLNFSADEQTLMRGRPHLAAQIHCALQIGYFKAKHLFFRVDWQEAEEDVAFILEQYFPNQIFHQESITKHQYYVQCQLISQHFNYRLWSKELTQLLLNKANDILRKDISPQFVVMELLAFLRGKKIMRPGYSTLQTIVSNALSNEKNRLGPLIHEALSESDKSLLKELLQEEEETLSELAELKRDAKNFKARVMDAEREKFIKIKTLYQRAKSILPTLKLSQENTQYYASLVHYYGIYVLRVKMKPEQAYLYLLCYIWQRYRKLNDNLIDAFCFHLKQFEDELRTKAKETYTQHVMSQQTDLLAIRQLAQLFVADNLSDDVRFGDVGNKAFKTIITKEKLMEQVSLTEKSLKEIDFKWQAVDKHFHRFKIHLRPLMMALDFSSVTANSPWLNAINWLKGVLCIKVRNFSEHPYNPLPV